MRLNKASPLGCGDPPQLIALVHAARYAARRGGSQCPGHGRLPVRRGQVRRERPVARRTHLSLRGLPTMARPCLCHDVGAPRRCHRQRSRVDAVVHRPCGRPAPPTGLLHGVRLEPVLGCAGALHNRDHRRNSRPANRTTRRGTCLRVAGLGLRTARRRRTPSPRRCGSAGCGVATQPTRVSTVAIRRLASASNGSGQSVGDVDMVGTPGFAAGEARRPGRRGAARPAPGPTSHLAQGFHGRSFLASC